MGNAGETELRELQLIPRRCTCAQERMPSYFVKLLTPLIV